MTPLTSGTAKIAEFIAETEYDDIPQKVIQVAKQGILDWLGVTILGATEPSVKILSEYTKGLGAREEASAICQRLMTVAELGAQLNGTMGHAMDFDDTFANSVRYNLHPTTCILPAVMALTEKLNLSGRQLLLAYIVGLEIEFRIGDAIGQVIPTLGWYPTPVLGTLGATAASAKVLHLNSSNVQSALGIAASLAGGLKKNVGSMTKIMHAGNAARNGVVAATLAKKGFSGNPLSLEGDFGFCEVFSNRQVKGLMDAEKDLGQEWMVISTGLAFKPYPCCRATHPSIDALLHLRKKYNLNIEQVVSITCKINPLVLAMTPYHLPKTGYEARFSMEYCIARALVDGEVCLDHFTDEKVREKGWQALISKIYFLHPDLWGHGTVDLLTEIVIRLTNGESYSHRVVLPKGEPENPMTEEELVRKFRQCSESTFRKEEIDKLIYSIMRLEKMEDLTGFFEILRNPHG